MDIPPDVVDMPEVVPDAPAVEDIPEVVPVVPIEPVVVGGVEDIPEVVPGVPIAPEVVGAGVDIPEVVSMVPVVPSPVVPPVVAAVPCELMSLAVVAGVAPAVVGVVSGVSEPLLQPMTRAAKAARAVYRRVSFMIPFERRRVGLPVGRGGAGQGSRESSFFA